MSSTSESPSSSPSAASPTPDGRFDPQAPLIGSDGLEYACFADRILNEPVDNYRNRRIQALIDAGTARKVIDEWVGFYDGSDSRFSGVLRAHSASRRVAYPRHAARAGAAGDLQAPTDSVHAAD